MTPPTPASIAAAELLEYRLAREAERGAAWAARTTAFLAMLYRQTATGRCLGRGLVEIRPRYIELITSDRL